MSKTDTINVRIEPEIKKQAEEILAKLGIPVSTAINMYYRQIVEKNGIPMEVKLTRPNLPIVEDMSEEDILEELDKGYKDIENGNYRSAEDVFRELNMKYELPQWKVWSMMYEVNFIGELESSMQNKTIFRILEIL